MTATVRQQPGEKLGTIASRLSALYDWSAGPVGTKAERAFYVLLFTLFVAVRMPRILLEGRF